MKASPRAPGASSVFESKLEKEKKNRGTEGEEAGAK